MLSEYREMVQLRWDLPFEVHPWWHAVWGAFLPGVAVPALSKWRYSMKMRLNVYSVVLVQALTKQCLSVSLWSFTVLKQSALCFVTQRYSGARLPGNSTLELRSMACKAVLNNKELWWFHSSSKWWYWVKGTWACPSCRSESNQTCRRYHYRSAYIVTRIIRVVPPRRFQVLIFRLRHDLYDVLPFFPTNWHLHQFLTCVQWFFQANHTSCTQQKCSCQACLIVFVFVPCIVASPFAGANNCRRLSYCFQIGIQVFQFVWSSHSFFCRLAWPGMHQ